MPSNRRKAVPSDQPSLLLVHGVLRVGVRRVRVVCGEGRIVTDHDDIEREIAEAFDRMWQLFQERRQAGKFTEASQPNEDHD